MVRLKELNSIKERVKKYQDILYLSPSDFQHVSAKYDINWLIGRVEILQVISERLIEIETNETKEEVEDFYIFLKDNLSLGKEEKDETNY